MAQETTGGATPSTPTLIQRALQWLDAVKLLAALCATLVAAHTQMRLESAHQQYQIATLEAKERERAQREAQRDAEAREMLVSLTEIRATVKAVLESRERR